MKVIAHGMGAVSRLKATARPCRADMALAVVLTLAAVWVAMPAVALGYHDQGGRRACDAASDWENKCECRYHVSELVGQQLIDASPDPSNPYEDRGEIKDDDERRVAWWRVESLKEACARMDLIDSAKGIIRLLAGSLTGIVGISFVWAVVQLMQESVTGGRVVEARNNLFRSLVGLVFFGFTWVIYESLTVGLFGAHQFTAGSFVGLTGTFGY